MYVLTSFYKACVERGNVLRELLVLQILSSPLPCRHAYEEFSPFEGVCKIANDGMRSLMKIVTSHRLKYYIFSCFFSMFTSELDGTELIILSVLFTFLIRLLFHYHVI